MATKEELARDEDAPFEREARTGAGKRKQRRHARAHLRCGDGGGWMLTRRARRVGGSEGCRDDPHHGGQSRDPIGFNKLWLALSRRVGTAALTLHSQINSSCFSP